MKKLRTAIGCVYGSKQTKYESRYAILRWLARKNNCRVYAPHMYWINDADVENVWRQFPASATTIHERRYNMFYFAKYLQHIDGDIAECGVFNGASAHMILHATKDTNKHYYGFDSFEGLSEPTSKDKITKKQVFKWNKNDLSVAQDIAFENLKSFEKRVTLMKGWIPERFQEVKNKTFCLVHIDVDLYEPTFDSLKFFYPLLSFGGWLVCDDYGSEACPGAFKAMNDFALEQNLNIIHLTTGQGIIIKAETA